MQNGLIPIGIGDLLGSGLSAFFWFYIAAVLTPESYGEIHYLISIAGIAQLFSLVGNSSALTGNLRAGTLTIEEGAQFEGVCNMAYNGQPINTET